MTVASVRQVAVVLAIVMLAGACGQSVATTPSAERRTESTARPAKATKAHAAPLVLEGGVPAHPPKVALVAARGGRQIVQRGVELTRDWTIGARKNEATRDYPVPWPRVSGIGRDDVVSLTLDTPIVPDWVVVKAYTKVVTGDLIPEAIPIAQYACVRLVEPRCRFERTVSGHRVTGLGQSILGGPYLVVFCMWHVPLEMQKSQTSPHYEVAASWLFHIAGSASPGDLQP